MTATPVTPERLSEIEMLRERARQWDGALTKAQHDDKRAALNGLIDRAIPDLLAEVARLSAKSDEAEAAAWRALGNNAELRAEVAETRLVLEQQDLDLGRQRAHIAALQSGHAEMLRGCEEWRAACDERNARIAALETGLREAIEAGYERRMDVRTYERLRVLADGYANPSVPHRVID